MAVASANARPTCKIELVFSSSLVLCRLLELPLRRKLNDRRRSLANSSLGGEKRKKVRIFDVQQQLKLVWARAHVPELRFDGTLAAFAFRFFLMLMKIELMRHVVVLNSAHQSLQQ